MMARLMTLVVGMIVGAVLVGTTILVTANVLAQEPNAPSAVSQVLNYQGRLLSPSTGLPKADGNYEMTFSIYNVPTGGSPLWTELQTVAVSNGFFSALLGSETALTLSAFNGQELFLGITLGGEAQMTPRPRLAHAAYAMHAETAGAANTAASATNATNAGTLDNLDSAAFAATSHNHSGAAITSGTVAEARIDGAMARDSEIFPTVLNNDGPGSGLNADTLDGINSDAFPSWSYNFENSGSLAVDQSIEMVSTQEWPGTAYLLWRVDADETGAEMSITNIESVRTENGGFTYNVTVQNTGAIDSGFGLFFAVLDYTE